MRTTNTIPPRHARPSGRRFGTDPETRPPMRPIDAYIAILTVVISALGVIAIVSGSVVMLGEIVAETRAEVARQAAPQKK